MAVPTEQEISDNFLGKPYSIKLTSIDGTKDFDFDFEQFDLQDLPAFMPLINKWLKLQDNLKLDKIDEQLGEDFMKDCIPWARKMVSMSCSWKPETIDKFVSTNLIVLIPIMFMANMMALYSPLANKQSDIQQFTEEERQKKIKEEGKNTENAVPTICPS